MRVIFDIETARFVDRSRYDYDFVFPSSTRPEGYRCAPICTFCTRRVMSSTGDRNWTLESRFLSRYINEYGPDVSGGRRQSTQGRQKANFTFWNFRGTVVTYLQKYLILVVILPMPDDSFFPIKLSEIVRWTHQTAGNFEHADFHEKSSSINDCRDCCISWLLFMEGF